MFSKRFELQVQITYHARKRMIERKICESTLKDIIETGHIRRKDDVRLWIFKEIEGRGDNLLCAAVALEDKLVVKTIIHHFQWE